MHEINELIIMQTNGHQNRMPATNSGFALWGLTCFVKTFVQGSTFEFRMNSSTKTPPQRKAAKRYKQLMRTLFIIFIWTTNLAFGQTIEQKALTYLADNIYGQELANSQGHFVVTKDSTKIWYYPSVHELKSELQIKNGTNSSEDKFYKIVHSNKDIFVTTKKAVTADGVLYVPFDITTKYGHSFSFKVTLENNIPAKLIRTSN